MKTPLLRFASVGLLALGLLAGCTTTVHMQSLAPAAVTMPGNMQRIATASRVLPESSRDKFFDVLEGIFTGEGLLVDRAGTETCALSVGEALMRNSPRFRVTPANLQLVGRTREFFLPPLAPGYVRQVCAETQVDGLVVLEAFDSDLQVTQRQEERIIKEKDKPDRKVAVTVAVMEMRLVTGFRTYGPDGTVVDQAKQEDRMHWTSEGPAYQDALRQLPPPADCIRELAARIGDQYARRIAPSYVNLAREVYTSTRKDAYMQQAKQMVNATDWTQAAGAWQKAAQSPDSKVAGRAYYNLAVFEELNNRLPEAIEYARKAAYTHQLRAANSYLRELQQRQQAELIVSEQLPGASAD
ncbi:DUF6340 family protein [Hymenobacter lapidiphilus]|uniref:Tetratricopeptide repeat protein n=1 Tax=Hymenobacter lapidiphilus TaxID=2608003 RepID=A0A7Y7PN09_9BACT|nr:DUF6340 family protein [Hymenobacter lapidiphilus]NVO30813.1 hypothetical protein [Hymenobacter lapidiphilus]